MPIENRTVSARAFNGRLAASGQSLRSPLAPWHRAVAPSQARNLFDTAEQRIDFGEGFALFADSHFVIYAR